MLVNVVCDTEVGEMITSLCRADADVADGAVAPGFLSAEAGPTTRMTFSASI